VHLRQIVLASTYKNKVEETPVLYGTRHSFGMRPRVASADSRRNLLRAERQNNVTLTELIASLNRRQAATEPNHLFGAILMLIGLELFGSALLMSAGYFGRLHDLFPPGLSGALIVMAVIGAGVMMTGIVLFARALRE
jgi:hypothetical protein